MIRYSALGLLCILMVGTLHGQPCSLTGRDDNTLNGRLGAPKIFGANFDVPGLTWQFISQTRPESIEVRYQWLWIMHPYPDHAFGAWETGEETVECSQPQLEMTIPARTIRPRGWYSGKYTVLPWQKPKFDQVELVIIWERNCRQTVLLKPKMLAKFRDHEAVLKRSCGVPEQVRFIRQKTR